MKNDLMRQIKALKIEFTQRGQRVEGQLFLDTLIIALNRDFGFSYARIEKLMNSVKEVRDRYADCFNPLYSEADVLRDEFDRVLTQICGESVMSDRSFAERYPDVKEITLAGKWIDPKAK